MGTFGCYVGNMCIPEEKREKFARQVAKILNYGGMMQFEKINMYGYSLGLLKPVELYPGGKIHFHFNYFEDNGWETAGFDAHEGYFYSEKIGEKEFCDVVTAVYFLYEAWDEEQGFVLLNGDVINDWNYMGWIDHILGTQFSTKKGFRIQDNMERHESQQLKAGGKQFTEAPALPVRTSDFLRQDGYFIFYDTPKELEGKPNYYISDDDRLYWWDGTDEVIFSKEMDEWLRELAVRHKEISKDMAGKFESSDNYFKDFLALLAEINQYYKRIYPFQNMFYEFIENGNKIEYRAAVKLLKRIANENREEGKIIEKVKCNWDIVSRNVTHNVGRLKLKRYLSVMANQRLREKYFDF